MTCPHCHYEVRDDAQYCSNCGRRVADTSPRIDAQQAFGAGERTIVRPPAAPSSDTNTSDTNARTDISDPLLGLTLDGRYKLTGHLGHGGMGTVYRARRLALGDDVAVKVLHHQFVAQASMLDRFRREARAAAMLNHPNIVAIYDFGDAATKSDGGSEDAVPAYIVMELLQGETLGALLKREGVLTPHRAVRILREVCAGLGAAHARGIVHRDLKPDNIIVLPHDEHRALAYEADDSETDERHETIKVVDFGIAKLRDMTGDAGGEANLTQVGTMLGTPSYMSPEQCRGEHLDRRSDVYSLGAIAFELLTGRPPFTAPTANGVIAKHLTEPVPPLALPQSKASKGDPELLRRLDRVIRRALAKEPHARQEDAMIFARELAAALRAPKTAVGSAELSPFTIADAPVPVRPTPGVVSAPIEREGNAPPAKSSRLGTFIGLALVAIAAALLSAMAWMMSVGGNSGAAINRNSNRNASPRTRPTATPRPTPAATPSPSPTVVATPEATPSVNGALQPGTPTNQTLPYDPARTAGEVQTALDGWLESTRNGDLERHISYYAPELENFYREGRIDRSAVRDERRRAFDKYSNLNVRLSNLRIQLDETGRAATAIFDKRWQFEGTGSWRGAVQQELRLEKVDDRWLIVGERDLRIYPNDDSAPR